MCLQFICDPADVHSVQKSLEGLDVTSSEVQFNYIPITFLTLGDDALELAGKMLDKLECVETVVRVYNNIEMSSWHTENNKSDLWVFNWPQQNNALKMFLPN